MCVKSHGIDHSNHLYSMCQDSLLYTTPQESAACGKLLSLFLILQTSLGPVCTVPP